MTEPSFDPLKAESRELDTLIEQGMSFTTPKRSVLKHFGKPERTFVVTPMPLGTLIALAHQYAKIGFDESLLQENPIVESKVLLLKNAHQCATIVAIAVLNRKWKIKLFAPLLASYFLERVTPTKLLQLTILINSISNLGDFIHAIRYLHMTPRISSPTRIAESEVD